MQRLQVDGKFFRAGCERVFLKMVTYGPFPQPRPEQLGDNRGQMAQIAASGFNAIRIYEQPDDDLLDAALQEGLWVFVGLNWEFHHDFVSSPSILHSAKLSMEYGLNSWGEHPAVAGVFVANEVPADMVRWMGTVRVRQALEDMIDHGRSLRPELLFAYANFPTTEYLEPENADFTAMNIYLEQRDDFASYLPRLHNVAGDRPVLLSEFGMDAPDHSMEIQREVLSWYVKESLSAGMAGLSIFAWSDYWMRNGELVNDWSFGLMDRSGEPKASLAALTETLTQVSAPEDGIGLTDFPRFSVVVCTRNGAQRMAACLDALQKLDYPDYEILVVDDGSLDDTVAIVSGYPGVRLLRMEHAGLSAARNRGAAEAKGDIIAYTDDDCQPDAAWLKWLAYAFEEYKWDACGGPNIPPGPSRDHGAPSGMDEVVVAAAPGAPTHVLLNDREAEHLPGCNMAIRKQALESIGGFDENYRIAGDDVDFCWRLQQQGYRMGFIGAAFVWHRRRASLWKYFCQQYQYGKAEALLMRDHPDRFYRGGGALWRGHVYSGRAMTVASGSVIYHGPMGAAPYQQLATTTQPERPIPLEFMNFETRTKLAIAKTVQPYLRAWARWRHSLMWRDKLQRSPGARQFVLVDSMRQYDEYEASWWTDHGMSRETVLRALLEDGWVVLENDSDWDCMRDGLRLLVAAQYQQSGTKILTRLEMKGSSRGHLPGDVIRRLEGLGLTRL